jgi:hypothetical protein
LANCEVPKLLPYNLILECVLLSSAPRLPAAVLAEN